MHLERKHVMLVVCPKCGAEPGQACIRTGKGSRKLMRLGVSHAERLRLAQYGILSADAKASLKKA